MQNSLLIIGNLVSHSLIGCGESDMCTDMRLTEWLQSKHGLRLEAPGGVAGEALEQRLYQAMVEAGCDYALQKEILFAVSGIHPDLAFGQACLDRIEAIGRFEERRRGLAVKNTRRCHSGVVKNKDWAPGADLAEQRFQAARTPQSDLLDAIDDMVLRLVERGYLEARPDIVRDLRQGLGYFRPGEDLFRQRRTAKWLKGQNALHCWVDDLLADPDPLCRVGEGAPGRWVTAASIFIDRNGRAFTYARLEHGRMSDDLERKWLKNSIPLSPSSLR